MRAIPACVPAISSRALKSDYEPWSYDLDELLGFISFIDDVLMPTGYEPSEDERGLMEHLRGLFAGGDEDEVFGVDESADAVGDDEPPFDADTIGGQYLDGHLVIAKAA